MTLERNGAAEWRPRPRLRLTRVSARTCCCAICAVLDRACPRARPSGVWFSTGPMRSAGASGRGICARRCAVHPSVGVVAVGGGRARAARGHRSARRRDRGGDRPQRRVRGCAGTAGRAGGHGVAHRGVSTGGAQRRPHEPAHAGGHRQLVRVGQQRRLCRREQARVVGIRRPGAERHAGARVNSRSVLVDS